MANQMRGQLRVDNELGLRAQVDTGINQVADNGVARFADVAAAGFAQIGARVGALADKAAAKEGAEAGRLAGLDPEFRTRADGTIFGEAFDRAGLDVAETRFSQQIENDFEAAALKYAADPAALNQELATREMAILANAPRELQASLKTNMRGKRLALGREQLRRVAAERASEAKAAMESQRDLIVKGIHQKAFALGLDPQADEVLADETKRLGAALSRRGPDGKLYIAPDDAAKFMRGMEETVATARLMGAFQRLPGLTAKAEFLQGLEEDFAAGKGLAKTYDLAGFEAVRNKLETELRAARSESSVAARAFKEDLTAVATRAEQGYETPPDKMAALRARANATGDVELAEQAALTERLLSFQSAARKSTPAELGAYIEKKRADLSVDDRDGRAQLELADKLLDTMRTELKRDQLAWAKRAGTVPISPIDFSSDEALSATMRARLAQGDEVAAMYGLPPVYLMAEEKQLLATAMAQGGGRALQVAGMIAGIPEGRGVRILDQLATDAPVMASIGHLVRIGAGGRPTQAAKDAVDALAARKAAADGGGGKYLAPAAKPKAQNVQAALKTVAGGALAADVRNQTAVIETANLIYEIRAARLNADGFKKELYEKALREALGEQTVNGVVYGGVHKSGAQIGRGYWRDSIDIVLPPDVRNNGWRDVIGMLTPGVLERAGIGQPVSETGKAIDYERFKRGTFVQQGNGQYYVALGDVTKPGAEQYARDGRTGKTLLLDFEKLTPVLRSIRPDLFLGGGG